MKQRINNPVGSSCFQLHSNPSDARVSPQGESATPIPPTQQESNMNDPNLKDPDPSEDEDEDDGFLLADGDEFQEDAENGFGGDDSLSGAL